MASAPAADEMARNVKTKTAGSQILSAPPGKSEEAMSFVDVGKRMKVSAEYTHRLCHRALDKLRSAADEGRLEQHSCFNCSHLDILYVIERGSEYHYFFETAVSVYFEYYNTMEWLKFIVARPISYKIDYESLIPFLSCI